MNYHSYSDSTIWLNDLVSENGMDNEIHNQQGISESSVNPINGIQHEISESSSNQVINELQEGTSKSSSKQVGQVESETIISVRSLDTESVNRDNDDSESKINVLERSKESVENQILKVSEPDKHNCVIDVKCSSGALSEESWDGEKVCRICHLGSDCSSEAMNLIQLGCGCKGELGIVHSHCAEAWFKVKGNRYCEICGKVAKNITGVNGNRYMEEWNARRLAGSSRNSSDQGGGCWRSQPFCNFLIACLVMAFVIPWFLRVNML